MKPEQLELILFTDTLFSSRQLRERYDIGNQRNSEDSGNLEEACWHGLFREMLPELFRRSWNRKKFVLWKVTKGDNFLELEYAEHPQKKEKHLSVNPYLFLQLQILS